MFHVKHILGSKMKHYIMFHVKHTRTTSCVKGVKHSVHIIVKHFQQTFSKEMKEKMGIEDNLLRLSVGLEDFEDLKSDLIKGFKSII